ncbi:MAG: SDR family oxidoreductase [Rickettsiales bacterium]|jgi:enoyl-[acyl-carrier protein] reductase I|nr:SDR family oxidoreductase [Rickettsiales bacterium]
MSELLKGKVGVILGVLNNKSIAWGIARELVDNGAEIALTYQGEIGKKRVIPLAEELNTKIVIGCDVLNDSELDNVFEVLAREWGRLDFLVHSIGYSDKNELKGRYYNTTRDNFKNTMDISVYSLVALTRRAVPLMEKSGGGSILTMTYYGSEKTVPNYNVMGVAKSALEASVRYLATDLGPKNIRVNAISSGPIKTLAASGIEGLNYMLKYSEINSPLRRNITPEDNGKTALYLVSDLSSGLTGEIIHLDSGYHVVGMKDPFVENIEIPSDYKFE